MADHPHSTELMDQPRSAENTVYNAAYCLTQLLPQRIPVPVSRRVVPCPEQVIKQLMEEHNFTFASDDLPTLKGFLIVEDGECVISVAKDLGRDERLFLYFHMLGHIALGHVPPDESTTIYEFRDRSPLPLHVRFQESRVDSWALKFIETVIGDATAFDGAIVAQLQYVLQRYTKQQGGSVASSCSRASTVLFERFSLYRRLRTRVEAWVVYRKVRSWVGIWIRRTRSTGVACV